MYRRKILLEGIIAHDIMKQCVTKQAVSCGTRALHVLCVMHRIVQARDCGGGSSPAMSPGKSPQSVKWLKWLEISNGLISAVCCVNCALFSAIPVKCAPTIYITPV